ncbi:MAG: MopE-related protein [bacterium]
MTRLTPRIAACIGSLLMVFGLGGCELNTFVSGGDGGWNFPDPNDDGGVTDDASTVTSDACVPTEEVCDGEDNDCDGVPDNGFDLTSDRYNCGGCGNICEFDYADATCIGSTCEMTDCFPGHWDNNGDPSDGCEYSCHQTNGGQEVCDGVDNDCDGVADEDFDLQNDPLNCGQCHFACAFFQGVGSCVAGSCELSSCRGGFVDKDGNAANGCECMMDLVEGTVPCDEANPVACGGTEVCADVTGDGSSFCATIPIDGCDGVDQDCDGQVDEDAPSQMAAGDCYTNPVGCTETFPGSGVFNCVGECAAGQPTCVGGNVVCGNQTGPAAELCDNLDNDCNGVVDDGYDKLNDPANCGGCGIQCSTIVAHGIPGCVNGGCVVLACLPGYYDLNGDPLDGCEYGCTISNGGVEICGDSLDNDCNGLVDDGFNFTNDPSNCGSCGNNCTQNVPFGTTSTGCTAGACTYACRADYYDLNGDLSAGQAGNGCEYSCSLTNGGVEICDNLDNNCDGQTDEGVNKQTDPNNCGSCGYQCSAHVGTNSVVAGCANGVCQFACAAGAVDLNGDVSIGDAGNGCEYLCTVTNGGVEACDGLDNDCDGQTDEDPGGGPMTQTCYSGPGGTDGVGPCHSGTRTCTGGAWTACAGELTPSLETCDGVDNDCDGSTDEAAGGGPLTQSCYSGPGGTMGVGLCVGGTQTCTGGAWGACAGEVVPQADVCDGADNDCDGAADEDYNTQLDVLNCGSCGYSCTVHAGQRSYAAGCVGGVCQYACQSNYYDINGDIALGDAGNGCEYGCTLTNGGVEACGDGIDNNCNGQVDEGFNLSTDANNCGSCGYSCAANTPYGATGNSCVGGACQYTCLANYYDINGDLALGGAGTGCEYSCTVSNGGVEACDNLDNDCDGAIDEDFSKDTNVNNCGSCGYQCSAHVGNNSVVAGCSNGICQFACAAGWSDLNGDVNQGNLGNGCEYSCTISNGGIEACDNLDNDCDGMTDEDAGGSPLSQPCYTGPGGTENVGQCHGGTNTCSGGAWTGCLGQVTPQSELCDNLDNDCDTQTDEDFILSTDLNNCGACNASCWAAVPNNAYPSACVGGSCQFTCLTGFSDLNGDLNSGGNGCEYTCPVYPPTAEYCDGQDNDCNGLVDDGVTAPVGFCYQGQVGSPCYGVAALCQDPDGAGPLPHSWYCQYPASVETSPLNPNQLLGYEARCDGLDGDCDGTPDDNFNIGAPCDDGGYGICRGTGARQCRSDQTGAECNITSPGATPTDEVCDGQDNDCDGLTDENSFDNNPANDPGGVQGWVIDDVVSVNVGGVTTYVYRYEASRPTSNVGSAGVGNEVRACSKDTVLPWAFVTMYQAARACARAGMRLCSAAEWYQACDGSVADRYPYGVAYNGGWCNGDDLGLGQSAPTGTQVNCDYATYGTEDMSGNLREWTSDYVGATSGGDPIYRLRGGSYIDLEDGLTCSWTNAAYVASVQSDHVGFRCCSTCGNGTVDANETCDGGAGCHPLFCGPITCGDGNLDAGEQCDDGNNLPFDGCGPACLNEGTCGNSIVEGGETCDDGNTVPLDGCSATCQTESWTAELSQNFNTCPAAGWVVQNGGEGAATWHCTNVTNNTGSPSGGNYMLVDSDAASSTERLTEGLVTPAVNLSGYTYARITFYHYFNNIGADRAYVQYSTNGQAGPWTTLVTYSADAGPGQAIVDASAAAGQSNVAFRFYYDDFDVWAWYWRVDDVVIEGM